MRSFRLPVNLDKNHLTYAQLRNVRNSTAVDFKWVAFTLLSTI